MPKNLKSRRKIRPLADDRRNSAARVQIGEGPPCSRCLVPTTAWKHSEDWTPPAGKGYYSLWYQCQNEACTTHQIMPPEAFVPFGTKNPP